MALFPWKIMTAAAMLGFAVACVGYVFLDIHPAESIGVASVDTSAALGARRISTSPQPSISLEALLKSPLLRSGTTPVPAPTVLLAGVSLAPSGRALLSIGGGPYEWIAMGAGRDDVEVVEVGATSVVVNTTEGLKTLTLGAAAAASPSPSSINGLAAQGVVKPQR